MQPEIAFVNNLKLPNHAAQSATISCEMLPMEQSCGSRRPWGLSPEGVTEPGKDTMATATEAFAGRLHEALDSVGFAKGRMRTGKLATMYNVSRETARKWLSGLALPELERMITIANDFHVALEWLATGRGPKAMAKANQVSEAPSPQYDPDRFDDDVLVLRHWVTTISAEQRAGLIKFLGL